MISGIEVLNYLNSFGIKAEYVLHWLETYKPILDIMFKRDVQYCFVEQLYNIYTMSYEVSYKHFCSLIKQGEEDSFWGTYAYGKHKVLYLKSNAFKCQIGVNRSSLMSKRITEKMLLRSALKMCVGTLNRAEIDTIDIYETHLRESMSYSYFTTTDKPLSNNTIKLLVSCINELMSYNDITTTVGKEVPYDIYNNYLVKEANRKVRLNLDVNFSLYSGVEFIIYSRYPLSNTVLNNIKKLLGDNSIVLRNVSLQDKIDKYFNYLPIV